MKIQRQRLILCTCAIILQVMLGHVRCDWLMTCGNCRCKWNSGKKTADCKNMTLTAIPEHLSSELQVVDLSFNKISEIGERAFVQADLQNLHKIFMKNCSLERIHPNGLKGLGILIEVDFSSNLIKTLPRDVFVGLVKVRSLILNGNLIETLESGVFRNLPFLHKVELKENRITHVSTDVFVNVPLLSQIFLNGNRLRLLRKETFEKLKRLTSLSLESNPWNCTCELRAFRDFALKRNLYTPPTSCYYPVSLRGTLWTDSTPEAFACKPKIIYPSRGASINTSKENVTLICRVHASPNTLIAWDYNKQMYSSNYQARVHIQLIREESEADKDVGRDIFISRLTIIGAEKSDEGIYTCLAENAGGKDEVQMNLLVQKHNHQNILLQNNLLIVICLMVLGLLSASIFLAMVTCCIYKRFKAINHRPGEDQQHQKRNFNSLNVVNSVNDSYHQNGETNYVEIKQTKVADGNLDAGTISDFTDLKNSTRMYHENNSQGSLHHGQQQQLQQTAQTNCSSLLPEQHQHKVDHHTGEYREPDLLPHVPQSISFNNSGLYSSVNHSTSCENQQQQHPHLQQSHHQQPMHHPEASSQMDDLRYANTFGRGSKYPSAQSSGENLHYGIIGTMTTTGKGLSGAAPAVTGSASTLAKHSYQDRLQRMVQAEDALEIAPASASTGEQALPRHSIVRTSPSLNFLTNYYQRRELL